MPQTLPILDYPERTGPRPTGLILPGETKGPTTEEASWADVLGGGTLAEYAAGRKAQLPDYLLPPPRGGSTTEGQVGRTVSKRTYQPIDPNILKIIGEGVDILRGIQETDPFAGASAAYNDVLRQMTEAYSGRGSAQARTAKQAGLMTGFTPLEAATAGDVAMNRVMRDFYQQLPAIRLQQAMLPAQRQEQLAGIAPLFGQLADVYRGASTIPLEDITTSYDYGQQATQQPGGMGGMGVQAWTQNALAKILQNVAAAQQVAGMGAKGGQQIGLDYKMGMIPGMGLGSRGPVAGASYPAAGGGFLAPVAPTYTMPGGLSQSGAAFAPAPYGQEATGRQRTTGIKTDQQKAAAAGGQQAAGPTPEELAEIFAGLL